MVSNRMANALNEQIKNEFYSAHLYLAMCAYFENMSFRGFADWIRLPASKIVDKLRITKDCSCNLLSLDKTLSKHGKNKE